MDPITAANLASAGISLGKGIHQAVKAHKLSKRYKRPEYKRPEEIKKSTDLYRKRAAGLGLPGENIMQEQIMQQQSDLMRKGRGAGDPTAYLQSLSSASQAGMDVQKDLRLEAADRKDKAMVDLASAYDREAVYADKEFQTNKMDPYQNAMASASALRGAAWENIESGMNKGISAGVSHYGGEGIGGSEGAVGQNPNMMNQGNTASSTMGGNSQWNAPATKRRRRLF